MQEGEWHMDKMLLKRISLQSIALMLAVVTLSFSLHQSTIIKSAATDLNSAEASEVIKQPLPKDPAFDAPITDGEVITTVNQNQDHQNNQNYDDFELISGQWLEMDPDIISTMGEQLLVIKKPKATKLEFSIEEIYISRSIKLHIAGSELPMDSSYIGRINKGLSYVSEPIYTEIEVEEINPEDGTVHTVIQKDYGMDFIYEITPSNNLNEVNGLYETEFLLLLDDIYTYSLMEDETYYYIGMKDPTEVYERILVIDAGHGGKDAGALSSDQNTYEKNINLKILLYLKEMLDKEDIKVYYTRLGDDKVFLRPRVQLANAVDCDFFISIHCNASESKNPNGSEILYYEKVNKKTSNKRLSKIFSEELETATTLKNRGLVIRRMDEIFILENALVPAIIIETGYITNQGDLSYLQGDENQKAIARGIYNGILRAYDELKPE